MWMISPAQEPDWQMLGRQSPCLLPPFLGSLQKGSCARYVMETSLLNLPMFVYLSPKGIYLIVRAIHKLSPCLSLLASDGLLFEAPSFVTSNLITVPFNFLYFPKLDHNPYRNQDKLEARNLGFNKSPAKPSMSNSQQDQVPQLHLKLGAADLNNEMGSPKLYIPSEHCFIRIPL